jgi:hypothetical protein
MTTQLKPITCILFLFIISFNSHHSKAQGFWEFGYKRGVWLNPGNLNDLIRDYNMVNPNAKFHTVHGAQGFKVTINAKIFEGDLDGGYFITGLQWLRNVQTTTHHDPILNQTDYRHLIVHYGGIFIGFKYVATEHFAFGFETAALNNFALRYQVASENKFGFGNGSKLTQNEEIVYDYNPDFSIFAQLNEWFGTDFAGISLTAKLDMPIYGPNELDKLKRIWNLNTQLKNNRMRGFNFNITAALQIGTAPDVY